MSRILNAPESLSFPLGLLAIDNLESNRALIFSGVSYPGNGEGNSKKWKRNQKRMIKRKRKRKEEGR